MGRPPDRRDKDMLYYRVVEGRTLAEIARICEVSPRRVEQRLHEAWGLFGVPVAAKERNRQRHSAARKAERAVVLGSLAVEKSAPPDE